MAKIVVDCGHGLNTSGKRCLKKLDQNETREWVLNDRVGVELIRLLKLAGHDVLRVDDPTGKTDVSLASRVAKANSWKADYYMSIHHNAGVGGKPAGGTVMYKYCGTGGKSKLAQEAIYRQVIYHGNLKGNRYDGTVDGNFMVIRETSMPAGLIECGFMDSSTDIKFILNPEWSKKVALGIAEGICEVFGGNVKASDGPAVTPGVSAPAMSSPVKQEAPATTSGLYRVRLAWNDAKSQKGAYKDLVNAKKCADANPGYTVFDAAGKAVYTSFKSYKVKVDIKDLHIRAGAGINYKSVGYTGKGTFTIVEEALGKVDSRGNKEAWGLLKGYQKNRNGWICLSYTKKA
jgi:N-acetylmuramoyl-L-alanine amidase